MPRLLIRHFTMSFCVRPATYILILLALLLALPPSRACAGTVSIAYEPTGKDNLEIFELIMENHIGDDVARVINDLNFLPHDIVIHFGTEEGPQYAPPAKGQPAEIHFPYDFVIELRRIFSRNGYTDSRQALDHATLDAVQHTLFHELGHAIIDMLHINTEGGEEDAVDSLATILLIESFDNGGDIALNAADAFSFLASEESPEEANPKKITSPAPLKNSAPSPDISAALDEHGLNEHRYEAIACLIYGSNPDRYNSVAKDLELSEQDAANCIENYARQAEYWFSHFQQ